MFSLISLRLINVLLRGMTLVGKFFLVFFLAKFLVPEDIGIYGLLAATVGFSFFVVGFEFYTYTTREMIGADPGGWLVFIRDQLFFFVVAYLVILPFLFLIFTKGWLPWRYVGWFFLLLVLEHAAQELNRLLVAMSEQLLASVILFLRSGLWCFLLILLMWWLPEARKLAWVFGAWSLGVGGACFLGFLRILQLDKGALSVPVDWRWIGRGVKIAIPLLVASLAIRGLFTFDRYWVENVAGLDVLGAYVLFVGIATSVVSFLDAGVVVFLYPQVVAAAKANDAGAFDKGMKKLFISVLVVLIVLVGAALLVSRPVLGWVGRNIYIDNFYLLKWLLLAVTIYTLSMVPHVGLYARRQDKAILYSQLLGFVIFFCGVLWGAPQYGVIAIPWSLCLSFLSILIWKFAAYRWVRDFKDVSI